ncbi:hypothetical protein LPJ61_000442 [Coemansia biformis]|uniref:WD40 repeat-like protein n=1 Tax=Coemansia biformis TaxID=1286918 RepID=A0A9W8CZ15_9FUNG|nr:hypothetical protein LPJ61_000442 [Coemansia biformis]
MALSEVTLRATNGGRGAPQARQTTLFDALGAAQRRHKRQRKAPESGVNQENTHPDSSHGCVEGIAVKRIRTTPAPCAQQTVRGARRAAPFALCSVHSAVRARQRQVLVASTVSTIARLESLVSPSTGVFRLQSGFESQASILPLACRYSNASGAQGKLALVDEGGIFSVFDTLSTNANSTLDAGLQPVVRWQAHGSAIFDVGWRMDNTQAVTASADETCRLWDVERQLLLGTFAGHSQTVRSVSWRHADIHCFTSASRDGSIMMWDVRCNRTTADSGHTFRPVNTVSHAHHSLGASTKTLRGKRRAVGGSVTAIRHLQHNTNLVASTGSTSETVKYWDVRMRAAPRESALPTPVASSQLLSPTQRSRGTSSLLLDPDGTRLYSACNDSRVYVHNALALGQPISRLAAPEFECQSFSIGLAISPCGRHLAAGSSSGSVVVWELDRFGQNSGMRRAVLQGHAKEAGCVAWYPGGERVQLATCGDDGILRVWEENPRLAAAGRSDPMNRCSWGFSQVVATAPSI